MNSTNIVKQNMYSLHKIISLHNWCLLCVKIKFFNNTCHFFSPSFLFVVFALLACQGVQKFQICGREKWEYNYKNKHNKQNISIHMFIYLKERSFYDILGFFSFFYNLPLWRDAISAYCLPQRRYFQPSVPDSSITGIYNIFNTSKFISLLSPR